jgi:hypothetical protein
MGPTRIDRHIVCVDQLSRRRRGRHHHRRASGYLDRVVFPSLPPQDGLSCPIGISEPAFMVCEKIIDADLATDTCLMPGGVVCTSALASIGAIRSRIQLKRKGSWYLRRSVQAATGFLRSGDDWVRHVCHAHHSSKAVMLAPRGWRSKIPVSKE